MLRSVVTVNPISGKVNDFNLYRYVGDSPVLHTGHPGEHTAADSDRRYDSVLRRSSGHAQQDIVGQKQTQDEVAAGFAEYSAYVGSAETAIKRYCVGVARGDLLHGWCRSADLDCVLIWP